MLSFLWKKPQSVNIKPLENRVQDIENKIQTLEQKITIVENSNIQLAQEIGNLTNQIQTLTNSIQPVLNNYRNFAKKNERNNFQELQEIQYPGEALSFIQDNNANYIHFKRSDGTRRGYLGIGSSNSKVMDVFGQEGVKVIAETGDLELNPKNGAINVNNKTIKNIADPTTPNDAISWDYLTRRINTIEGSWKSFLNNKEYTWPNIRGGIYKVINIEGGYGDNPNTKTPVHFYDTIIENNNNNLKFKATGIGTTPGPLKNLYVKLTYITLR